MVLQAARIERKQSAAVSTIAAGDVRTIREIPRWRRWQNLLPSHFTHIAKGVFAMSTSPRRVTCAGQSTLLIALVSLFAVGPAYAGDCPAGKAGANPLAGAATAPVGVTEMELSSIDLGKEAVNLPQRRLRYRHMEIAPGGIVPLHTHADRPALIMVNQGQSYEYSSQCTVPILHKAV